MKHYENTDELLAVKLKEKYPNSYHLFPRVEKNCKVINETGRGWGRLGMDFQGLDTLGRIIGKVFDVQFKDWGDRVDQSNQSKKKNAC